MFKAAEKKIYLYGPKFNGKWTRADAGQAKFLGVSKPGMKAYLDLMAQAEAGRHPSKLPIEQAVLDAVRLELDIQGSTYEEERARKRRRTNRPVQAQPRMAEAQALAMFQDEGSDDEDE